MMYVEHTEKPLVSYFVSLGTYQQRFVSVLLFIVLFSRFPLSSLYELSGCWQLLVIICEECWAAGVGFRV